MKVTFYNPTSKMIYTQTYDNPWYYILRLRCLCFRIEKYNKYGNKFAREILNQGGFDNVYYIVSNSIPFCINYDGKFVSYDGIKEIEEWINEHPGESVLPIQSSEELNLAIAHKHDWDNRKDMYLV